MEAIEHIRDKARELLESQAVECVIGYERATDNVGARPLFAYEPGEVARFIFDQTCHHNLTRYLRDKKGKTVAVVAKPCDSRAINMLINEKQLERERVFIIGVVCPGMAEVSWNRISQELQALCRYCRQHTPVVYDFLAGEPPAEEPEPSPPYSDVAEMEAKSVAERRAFWSQHFERCIRCYACRQACPGCYCTECFVDRLDPLWVGIRIALGENEMWNTIRAYHLAGRCIDCGSCQQACPVNIPLMLLNRKLEKDVKELFDFQAGLDAENIPPLVTFKKEEKLEADL